jgi:hypothetical protein
MVNNKLQNKELTEAINSEADLMLRLTPLQPKEIFDFMAGMKKGTLFGLGQYSSIGVSAKYKKEIRIYKVIEMTNVVSGVEYENKETTKEFRDATGKLPGGTWWKHKPGWETKVGEHKDDPNKNYVLWYINKPSRNTVKYFLVDTINNVIQAVKKDDIKNSIYLTASQKAALDPKPSVGDIDLTLSLQELLKMLDMKLIDHIIVSNNNSFSMSKNGLLNKENALKYRNKIMFNM